MICKDATLPDGWHLTDSWKAGVFTSTTQRAAWGRRRRNDGLRNYQRRPRPPPPPPPSDFPWGEPR